MSMMAKKISDCFSNWILLSTYSIIPTVADNTNSSINNMMKACICDNNDDTTVVVSGGGGEGGDGRINLLRYQDQHFV